MTSTPPPRPTLRFALFGGVRVWRGDVELALGPPKQRATLGLLLAAGGQPVTIGQLMGVLWDDEPAATALNQIHRYVGVLRRIFEPDLERRAVGRWLLPIGAGYRLAVDEASCDLLRYRSLVVAAGSAQRAGSAPEATRLLVQAMDIAAAAPGDELFRDLPMVVAIEDDRIRVAVTAAEQALLCGMAADVLPGLRNIAAEHALDETAQASLMRCLNGVGRPSEALATYDRIRARLRQELGADPGPALVDAQRAVLAQPPALDIATTPGSTRPAQLPAAPTAFAGRLDVLAAIASDGSGRRARVHVVSGMAGVGKTTLALHWAHAKAPDHPDGQLYVNLRGFDAADRAVDPGDALRDLLQSLGVAPAALPAGVDARAAVFRTLLATRRILIVLDNARDARQVQPLLPGRSDSIVIITSRNRLTSLVALELLANELTNSIAPLDLLVDDAAEVDLREVLAWSYRALSPDARLTIRALAVHPGPEISLAAAVSMSALAPARTRTALSALTAANLLRETTPGRFAFHDLVRGYALEQPDTDTTAVTARLVDHYVRSTRAACLQFGRPPHVPLDPPIDGVVPEQPSGVVEAIHWYQREQHALRAVVQRAAQWGAHRAVLLITLDWRPMSHGIDAPRDMLAFTTLALAAAGSLDEATLTAECYREAAAKFAGCGDLETAGVYYTSALTMFEEAGDLAGQANTLRNLAVNFTNDPAARVRQAEHAVRLARRCGIPHVLGTALATYGYILLLAGQGRAALPVLSEALALARDDPGDESLAARVLAEIAKSYAAAGDIRRAVAVGERALAALRTMNDHTTELDLLADHGDALLASGQPERAIEAWERYLALSSNIGIVDGLAAERGITATEALARVRKKLARAQQQLTRTAQ